MLPRLKQIASQLKADTFTLYYAARDPATPWFAKLLIAIVVAYAFSPIDLIPDFIPVLGYLDDILLVPLGVALAIRLIPPAVLADCRTRAQAAKDAPRPVNWLAGAIVVTIWVVAALGLSFWLDVL